MQIWEGLTLWKLYNDVHVEFLPNSSTHVIVVDRNGHVTVDYARDAALPSIKRWLLLFARTRDENSHFFGMALDVLKIILRMARLIDLPKDGPIL